jgi:hypothetical protein
VNTLELWWTLRVTDPRSGCAGCRWWLARLLRQHLQDGSCKRGPFPLNKLTCNMRKKRKIRKGRTRTIHSGNWTQDLLQGHHSDLAKIYVVCGPMHCIWPRTAQGFGVLSILWQILSVLNAPKDAKHETRSISSRILRPQKKNRTMPFGRFALGSSKQI